MNERQLKVLNYIKRYVAASGYAPTYSEIAEDCDVSSDSHAHKVVKALVRDGYLTIASSGVRKIRLSQATSNNNA